MQRIPRTARGRGRFRRTSRGTIVLAGAIAVVALIGTFPGVIAGSLNGTSTVRPIAAHGSGAAGTPIPSAGAAKHAASGWPPRGHLPQSWRGAAAPPGSPTPRGATGANVPGFGVTGGNSLRKHCEGLWPYGGGQSQYLLGCYGHDEPGLDPYSTLAGSGGNVSWTVTLPTDRSTTQNQSNLYVAIWFGMTLTDPYAWMKQCFLELQFYPDSSWGIGSAYGEWIGAAVAWQIEAATGYEDPCFYQALVTPSGGYFNMTEGDTIQVVMTGWAGSSNGENISISDVTSGQQSFVQLYNSAYGYPLNPAYSTATYPNSLQWTPGGEMPVTFAFETGHTGNSNYPNNNSYGGCSAGPPPPTPTDPAVPCPSYDPGAWANDSLTPWLIQDPVFFNAQQRQPAAQVGFTQDLGAVLFIDPISGGTCTGRDGSAYCAYPWYSYSCASQAFEFGAMDYPRVTTDFGQDAEYPRTFEENAASLGYYPPGNFSVPSCGHPTATVNVTSSGTPGTARLGGWSTTSTRSVAGLTLGNYSLSAVPDGSGTFTGWVASGSVTIADPKSPYTSLLVAGNGSVTAQFGIGLSTVTVHFVDSGGNGWQAVAPTFLQQDPSGTRTFGVNATAYLAPGTYSIQGYPDPGYEFADWRVTAGSAQVAAVTFPFTWLTLPASSTAVTIHVDFFASAGGATVNNLGFLGTGYGDVYLNGSLLSSGTSVSLPVGTYAVKLVPSVSGQTGRPVIGGSAVAIDYNQQTNVTFENGTSYLAGNFSQSLLVKLTDLPSGGKISFNADPPRANGSVVPVTQYAATEFPILADPPAGESFSHWSVSNANALWLVSGNKGDALITNSSATLSATFSPATADGLTFKVSPAIGGAIRFAQGTTYGNSATNSTVTNGSYRIEPVPTPGYAFSGWSVTGAASVLSGGTYPWPSGVDRVHLTGTGATLTATFTLVRTAGYPVTFVADPPLGSAKVNGTTMYSGDTHYFLAGTYSLNASAGSRYDTWVPSTNLSVGYVGKNATLTVNGSGTIYGLTVGSLNSSVTASPTIGTAPLIVTLRALGLNGTPPYTVTWSFGDSTTGGVGAVVHHRYTTPGNYTAAATVRDAGGDVSAGTAQINVLVAPLTTNASASRTTGVVPLNVTFFSHAVGGAAGPITYDWSFGDQSPAAFGAEVWHVYNRTGTFSVVVFVNDSGGRVAHAYLTIVVVAPLVPTFQATPLSGFAPLWVNFTGGVQGGEQPYGYRIDFGDGLQSASETATHEYTSPGLYTATFVVTDGFGDLATKLLVVNVTQVPALHVRIAGSPTKLTVGGNLSLASTVSGGLPPFSYAWSGLPPGCGTPTTATAKCSPTASGNFTAKLAVTDTRGTRVTNTTRIEVDNATGSTGGGGGGSSGAGTTSGPPSWLWPVVGVLVAAVAIGTVLAALRRRRRNAEGAAPEGEVDSGATDPGAPPPPLE